MSVDVSALQVPGAEGRKVAAHLTMPTLREPRAFVLFAQCFTCASETQAPAILAQALADLGLGTLRLDFEEGGDNFASHVADIVAASRWLEENHVAPAILVGHSIGGTAVLAAAAQIPSARAVATINATSEHVTGLVGPLRRALLVMHAPADTVVSVDHAAAIFVAAKHPKSFVSLDSADHVLSRPADAQYAATVLAAWADRYLPPPPAIDEDARDVVKVTETHRSKFEQRIVAGPHRLIADEPVAVGGTDSGPTPYDLLLAALGACTAMTVRLYADAKGIPLTDVSVDLMHAKTYATDCAECETKEGKIDRIERVVKLTGDLDDAMRAKLLEIANKCPVHRTLHAETWVPTRLG